MAIRYYPARIVADDDTFMFQAIDIPEAISAGDTPEEALAHGTEALQLAVETWDARDGALPEPSTLKDAMAGLTEEQRADLVTVQLVPVALPENAIKISVTLPGDLLKRIDAVAGEGRRSGFLAQAARDKLAADRPMAYSGLSQNEHSASGLAEGPRQFAGQKRGKTPARKVRKSS